MAFGAPVDAIVPMLALRRVAFRFRQAIIRRSVWHCDQVRARENASQNANKNGGCELRGST